jgi:sister chromatid cohesion protein DCC1
VIAHLPPRRLCLKGAAGEEAVLCSASKTFAVKTVETSNLVLLVPRNAYEAARSPPPPRPPAEGLATQQAANAEASARRPAVEVTAIVGSHLELVPSAPRLQALDRLLSQRQYGAEEEEDEDAAAAMQAHERADGGMGQAEAGSTWEELVCEVQASGAELRAALRARGAVRLGARWRGVDAGYLGTLLEMLLLTAVEQGWANDAVPGAAAAAALAQHGYPPALTLHCLRWFGGPAAPAEPGVDAPGGPQEAEAGDWSEGEEAAGARAYALRPAAVCRHFALKLLAAQPRWERGADFLAAWTACVPEGMTPHLGMLRGEVLLDADAPAEGGAGVSAFSACGLPRDAPARFAALFARRPRWELPALAPYIQDLAAVGQTEEELLLRFARATQARPADAVTYSAR